MLSNRPQGSRVHPQRMPRPGASPTTAPPAQALTSLKRTDTFRGSGHTYRNAMAYLFASDPDRHLANVFLESDVCISCFYKASATHGQTLPLCECRSSMLQCSHAALRSCASSHGGRASRQRATP